MEKNFQSEVVARALLAAKGHYIIDGQYSGISCPWDDRTISIWAVEYQDQQGGDRYLGSFNVHDWAVVRPLYVSPNGKVREAKVMDINRTFLVKGSDSVVERCREYNGSPQGYLVTRAFHVLSGVWHTV